MTRKHSGNTHAKYLESPGNTQETLTKQSSKTQKQSGTPLLHLQQFFFLSVKHRSGRETDFRHFFVFLRAKITFLTHFIPLFSIFLAHLVSHSFFGFFSRVKIPILGHNSDNLLITQEDGGEEVCSPLGNKPSKEILKTTSKSASTVN